MLSGFNYNGTSLDQCHLEKYTSHGVVIVIFMHGCLDVFI